MVRKPRIPGHVRVGTVHYTIVRGAPKECEGATVPEACTIHIATGMAKERQAEVLAHEIFHAAAAESGAAYAADLNGEDAEEAYARHAVPVFLRALEDAGLIKLLF